MTDAFILTKTFDEERERQEQRGDEWVFGAIQKDLAAVPLALRAKYRPKGVRQHNGIMDTNGCASRGPLNKLERKLSYFYDHGMHPAIKKWCNDNGYRVDGRFVLCDAFIEILSGTTRQGNSLKAPIDAIRKYGVIPAYLLPLEENMTWEEYMERSRVKQEHLDLGAEFLRRLTINYEKVTSFIQALEQDSLIVATHAWPLPVNGVYPRTNEPFNHVVELEDGDIDAFDNYEPFLKRLARDYRFFDWGYSISITNQTPYPVETVALFNVLQRFGLLAFFAEAYKRLIAI